MGALKANDYISRNPEVEFARIDDDIILHAPNDKHSYGVNAVGAEIWSALEAGALPLSAICDHVCSRFAVEEEQGRAHVVRFVEEMIALDKLILPASEPLKPWIPPAVTSNA